MILVDAETIITGSYNFSGNAEQNAENLLVIREKELAEAYRDNFARHLQHAPKYKGLVAAERKEAKASTGRHRDGGDGSGQRGSRSRPYPAAK